MYKPVFPYSNYRNWERFLFKKLRSGGSDSGSSEPTFESIVKYYTGEELESLPEINYENTAKLPSKPTVGYDSSSKRGYVNVSNANYANAIKNLFSNFSENSGTYFADSTSGNIYNVYKAGNFLRVQLVLIKEVDFSYENRGDYAYLGINGNNVTKEFK